MKQCTFQQEPGDQSASSSSKIFRLFFDSQTIKEENKDIITEYSVPRQLHLFVPMGDDNEQKISTKFTSNTLTPHPSAHSTTKEIGDGSYFSYRQWQELELQALIYRHLLAGAAIPHQLLQMVHKSLYNNISLSATNPLSSSYYPHPLQKYSHYNPALLQSGYWGRAAMDPEPDRCRRTDGKKWRCSRDVMRGHKYCERHIHRGRNRSRKPVEPPITTTLLSTLSGTTNATSGIGVPTPFVICEPQASIEPFLLAQRPSGPGVECKFTSEIENTVNNGNLKPGGQALRHFIDDSSNRSSDISSSSTSDFSLKLATGNGNQDGERERARSSLGSAWWDPTSQVAPMGGPLAEALRSSRVSNASSTSELNLVK